MPTEEVELNTCSTIKRSMYTYATWTYQEGIVLL
jgi:hypothetical protein